MRLTIVNRRDVHLLKRSIELLIKEQQHILSNGEKMRLLNLYERIIKCES